MERLRSRVRNQEWIDFRPRRPKVGKKLHHMQQKGFMDKKFRKRDITCNYALWFSICIIYGFQAFVVGWAYLKDKPDLRSCWWTFMVLEAFVFVYMFFTPTPGTAIMGCCSQWAMISFVGAGKMGVLYFLVQPTLEYTFPGPLLLMLLVFVYPLLYLLMMLRTQISIFKSMFPAPSIEACLFQNMMWHVLMDFLDIAHMFRYNSKGFQDGSVARIHYCPDEQIEDGSLFVEGYSYLCQPMISTALTTAIGIFVSFGFCFHALSFPGVGLRSHFVSEDGNRAFLTGMKKKENILDKIDLTQLQKQDELQNNIARDSVASVASIGSFEAHPASLPSLESQERFFEERQFETSLGEASIAGEHPSFEEKSLVGYDMRSSSHDSLDEYLAQQISKQRFRKKVRHQNLQARSREDFTEMTDFGDESSEVFSDQFSDGFSHDYREQYGDSLQGGRYREQFEDSLQGQRFQFWQNPQSRDDCRPSNGLRLDDIELGEFRSTRGRSRDGQIEISNSSRSARAAERDEFENRVQQQHRRRLEGQEHIRRVEDRIRNERSVSSRGRGNARTIGAAAGRDYDEDGDVPAASVEDRSIIKLSRPGEHVRF
jgi:hypothetical protein